MNREELKQLLEKEGINPRFYSIYGPLGDEFRYILNKEISMWTVYYTERGKIINKQLFNTEDEACRYFLAWIKRYPELKTV